MRYSLYGVDKDMIYPNLYKKGDTYEIGNELLKSFQNMKAVTFNYKTIINYLKEKIIKYLRKLIKILRREK